MRYRLKAHFVSRPDGAEKLASLSPPIPPYPSVGRRPRRILTGGAVRGSSIALGSGERLGALECYIAGDQVRPETAARQVIPIEILQRPLSLYKNGSLIFSISMRPLNTVLRIKRTLDGAEIDKIISDVETSKALAMERRRRADWRKRELAASRFRAECDHCHGLNQIGCGSW